MSRSTHFFLYCAYTVAALLFFLYIRFPSDVIHDYVMENLTQIDPGIQVRTEIIKPAFPVGIVLSPLSVSYNNVGILHADDFSAKISLTSLFKETKQIIFSGSIGDGQIEGQTEWAKDDRRSQIKTTLHLTDIPLETFELANHWTGYKPYGTINAAIDFDTQKGGTGSATLQLQADQPGMIFQPSLMGLERLEFTQIQAEVSVNQRMLQIKRCEASGPLLNGKITGSILIRKPLGSSRLTLSCSVKPEPAFSIEHKKDLIGSLLGTDAARQRGVVFRFTGTLDNPNYTMR